MMRMESPSIQPPKPACDESEHASDHCARYDDREANDQRNACPLVEAGKDVSAQVVCAHRVLQRRGLERGEQVDRERVLAPDQGPEHRQEHKDSKQDRGSQKRAVVNDETEGGTGGVHRPAAGTGWSRGCSG